jgi:outer membrane protein OmpA-like peptidoglycan-associated protein/Flp pilus assembly protein TadD
MKKILNLLLLGAVSLTMASCAITRMPADFSGIVCGEPVFDVQQNGTVKISFCVEVPADYFSKRITFSIMPSILYANGDVMELPYYTVQGFSIVDTNYPVVDWSVQQVLCYSTTVRYHDGLATATLQTDGWIMDCLTKEELLLPLCNWGFSIPMPPVLPVYMAHFASESDARAALKGKIYFPVNGYTVTNAIAGQPEITRVLNSLKQLTARNDFVITRIDVEGNASPEGTARINDPLAKRRAENTRNFFAQALKDNGYDKEVPASAWTVTSTSGMGFWNEFYTAMKESEVSNKDQLAERFLRLASNPAEAEKQIRAEIASNAEVKNLMLPLLRYGSVSVNFEPIQLSAEEIRIIADNQPEYLTPNDIIQAASDLEPDDAIMLYKRSLERYPDAVELYVNLAYNQILNNQLEAAQTTLTEAKLVADEQDEKDMIALQCACIAMRQGEFDNAASALDAISDKDVTEYYRGVLAIYQNDNDKAVRLLSGTKDINYAIALLNKNQVKDALKVLQNLDQNDAYVLYTTGVAYGRINENAKARDFKAKAFQLDPSLRYLDN